MALYGRERERAALGALAEEARASRSGVLVVRGAPGAGKSALLEDLAAGTEGMRVLLASGIQNEAELAFSGLHQLLWPLRPLVEQLAAVQATALRGVLGMAEAPLSDRFLAGAATLDLLAAAAEQCPLLCLVDDAHWLDGPSAEAITFAVRRLHADPVAVVLAVRDGQADWLDAAGFQEIQLGGLDPEAADALLAKRAGQLDAALRADILQLAQGNPLALLELPLADAGGRLTSAVGGPLPLTPALEDAFLTRARALPGPSQRLLLLAAADSTADPAMILGAAQHVGDHGVGCRCDRGVGPAADHR